MTALQFIATFRSVTVHNVGADDDIYWMFVEASVDGTETQFYLVMESLGQARFVQNPASFTTDNVHEHFKHSERCE